MPPLNALLQVTDQVPIARCSDCKCKRPLVHFEARRCCATRQRSPPSEAMINWDELDEFNGQFHRNPALPINVHLPDNLVDLPVDDIVRHFIVHLYDTSGFIRSAIDFYASCTSKSEYWY
ncbi:hypothetical protein DM01DRAFT_1332268 [Hesseltinella vesiculosa]|uniref:Uncharacterized protein n=1 Tax=Hesseltinella vesiculosa TaxID=101127 RepID=A0A1X2GUI5_9FUNG|nr:hypothetical protein DM01DRAFT_1332268 [Hesseltinella vesiculosa]